ncbi:hypothetical protein GA0116948_102180 [Chitinophaga costaii]|uniref:Transposase n=1 Tax=Chitinophaga costaii TaxID=1335309 RepID=A0A1C4AKM5_9BACT|nr:hypothetical protein [Chitinophaga costaii]PUZ26647.1 hypothetical protein DCM91_09580 [Chitinophaga costaii]SCB95244.1 hypothetical protein GA0116948_102180 [Chitinophaga costaii]
MPLRSTLGGTRSKEAMLGLITKRNKSTMTVKAFCQQHGLKQGVFYYWQKKYHLERNELGSQGGFIELRVEYPRPVGTSQGLFAEVRGIKLYQAITASYLNELLKER